MLQGKHSAILSTFIKLPFVIKIFVLSIFEWPLKTGFTILTNKDFVLFLVFVLLIYVNMTTIVGILTLIEQDKIHAQLN